LKVLTFETLMRYWELTISTHMTLAWFCLN
jgi:hypothetical protein